jgi:hypothetical protein
MVGISGARILIIFPKPPLHRQTKAAFQREIEEYRVLSEQVTRLTNTISEGVEKIRASVDRPQCSKQLQ